MAEASPAYCRSRLQTGGTFHYKNNNFIIISKLTSSSRLRFLCVRCDLSTPRDPRSTSETCRQPTLGCSPLDCESRISQLPAILLNKDVLLRMSGRRRKRSRVAPSAVYQMIQTRLTAGHPLALAERAFHL